jgi:hypothetical protein
MTLSTVSIRPSDPFDQVSIRPSGPFDQVSIRPNVHSIKWPFRQSVHSTKWPFRPSVHSTKWPFRPSVHSTKCPFDQMALSTMSIRPSGIRPSVQIPYFIWSLYFFILFITYFCIHFHYGADIDTPLFSVVLILSGPYISESDNSYFRWNNWELN